MERRRSGDDREEYRRRGDDRGSDDRGRDRDRGDDRGSRDSRDDRGSRDRDRGDDRGRDRERGSSRGGYEYQRRTADDYRERSDENSKFDKFLKGHIKMWKPRDGENRIRILPPTWAKAKHYGLDIHVHYGVGADRQTYLCLNKMRDEPDPICDERARFARDANADNESDKEYLRELESKHRVLVYLVDRDNEREGVQAWTMPEGVDRDIVKVSVDRDTGEVLPIDHPDEGFDVTFDKTGTGKKTKYEGISIARRSSRLGKDEWMDFAVENPLPDQLVYFDAAHIAKEFGGGSGPNSSSRDRDDRGGRDRDRDERPSRDRDDHSRDRDDRGSRDRNEKPEYTWESVHDMRKRELEDLIEAERLDINPKEAKDDEDLADWICEELKLKKPESREERRRADDRGGDKDPDDRMERMRDRLRDRD